MFEKKFKIRMNEISKQTKPSLLFRIKMEYRIFKKGVYLFFRNGNLKLKMATAGGMLVVFFSGGIGTYAYASSDVTPDSFLYPVKQGIERIEIGLAFSPTDKARKHLKMAFRRLDENDVLRDRINRNVVNANAIRYALERTLLEAQNDMNTSVELISSESVSEPSAKVLGEFELKLAKMHNRMKHCKQLRSSAIQEMMMKKMNMLEQRANANFNKIRKARMRVIEIIQNGKNKRVLIRDVMN